MPNNFGLGAIVTADVNADSRTDLLIGGVFMNQGATSIGPLRVLLNNGNATFNALAHQRGVAEGIGSIVTTDLDKDGKLDLIMTADSTRYYYGNGDGTFHTARHLVTGQDSARLFLADITGDGAPELAALSGGGVSLVLLPAVSRMASSSAASAFLPPVSPDSIVSAYGAGLATATAGATAMNQTELAGTTSSIVDSNGARFATPLFFVSAGQVNYLVPAGVALGTAQVTIKSSTGKISQADLPIDRVAPGLFVFPGSGDLLAANVIRVRSGVQTSEDVFTLAGSQITPRAIDMGPATDALILVLYGTGIRGRTSLAAVRANIGGIDVPVDYAGAQGAFPGLDQINVAIPRSLAGRGKVNISLSLDGKQTNIGNLTIR